MGIKGRDILIWLFYLGSTTVVVLSFAGYVNVAKVILLIDIAVVFKVALLSLKARSATKKSRERGFKLLTLLPVSRSYANILLRFISLDVFFTNAYELHVDRKDKYIPEFERLIREDLELLSKVSQQKITLYIWETNVPIPSKFRRRIKSLQNQGLAVWEKGRWPVPAPPFVYKNKIKKYVRRGALVLID